MAGPLSDILVLDFSTLLPGPLATLFLAEAGAEVIKLERPGGEDMHRFPPAFGETSVPWAMLNRGKTIRTIDLKNPADIAGIAPLLERADVLVEQFRPGVMDRLGLGYEALRERNRRLVYCSVTGYGQTGPRSGEAGHDINYQAVTGLLSQSPGSADQPTLPPSLTADIAGGAMPAVINILLALRDRDRTGQGVHLDIAMSDAMFTFAWYGLAQGHATGVFPGAAETMLTGGSPRYRPYATRDGRFLAVGALEDKFWTTFCEAVGLASGLRDARADPRQVAAEIERLIRARDSQEWRAVFTPLDCCCTIVATLDEALADEHFRRRGLFDRVVRSGSAEMPAMVVPIAPVFRDD
jgi:crotonobetainyl-CoA:carnitine CoA-transferase CaiB-like acyl-CoA transferase